MYTRHAQHDPVLNSRLLLLRSSIPKHARFRRYRNLCHVFIDSLNTRLNLTRLGPMHSGPKTDERHLVERPLPGIAWLLLII